MGEVHFTEKMKLNDIQAKNGHEIEFCRLGWILISRKNSRSSLLCTYKLIVIFEPFYKEEKQFEPSINTPQSSTPNDFQNKILN